MRHFVMIQEIFGIQSALGPKKLSPEAFNRRVCWEADQETSKA